MSVTAVFLAAVLHGRKGVGPCLPLLEDRGPLFYGWNIDGRIFHKRVKNRAHNQQETYHRRIFRCLQKIQLD